MLLQVHCKLGDDPEVAGGQFQIKPPELVQVNHLCLKSLHQLICILLTDKNQILQTVLI